MSDRETLKPCPLCGSNDLEVVKDPVDQWIPWFRVLCRDDDCHTLGPARRDKAKAIAAWSTRASHITPQATPEGVDDWLHHSGWEGNSDVEQALRQFIDATASKDATPEPQVSRELLCAREALEAAADWHDEQGKAVSKQPNANTGTNGWMRLQHQEQSAALRDALARLSEKEANT